MSCSDYELQEGTVFETWLAPFRLKDLEGSVWALQGYQRSLVLHTHQFGVTAAFRHL